MKTLKIMPDYHCFPLWDMTSGAYGDLDPRTLPISELLQTQLMNWAKVYDETLNLENPSNSGFSNSTEKKYLKLKGCV